jgi:hydroxyethylthiazole kinase-like uncharacterized protein yjeF
MTALADGTAVYTTEEIRRIEALAVARADPPRLMERAGLAAAELARELAGGSGKPVAILAGPGNNGGDAFVAARHLKSWWFNVVVTFTGDAQKLSPDAAEAFEAWRSAGGTVTAETPQAPHHALVVDGLFGIGLQRDIAGRYAELVKWINEARAPVLALDVPSGLESDSGRVLGCAVRASHTITFMGLKPGLLTLDGPDHCGTIQLAPLGADAANLVVSAGSIIGSQVLGRALPARRANSHKGSYGSVGIIGGAPGMVGAAILAGRAALKLGAGRVYVGITDEAAPAADTGQPELMLRHAEAVLEIEHLTSLAVGPGLGQSTHARTLLQVALRCNVPLVLDADALNIIATDHGLRSDLMLRSAPTLLTPHPAEAARLLGVATGDIQRDRVAAALKLAETHRSAIVLKGAGSVCAGRNGRWAINTSGNPGMATAGMGDVLTGILAALLAQGVDADVALAAAVYLHGAAADALVAEGKGPVGLTAGETIDAARLLINRQVMKRSDEKG